MGYTQVTKKLDDAGILTITLDGPESMNGLAPPMLEELSNAFNDAVTSRARSIVLTGAGRAFCAGADLRHASTFEKKAQEEHGTTGLQAYYHPFLRSMRDCPIPMVAAVNGVAGGAGMSLALMCDIICAGRSAYFLQAFRSIGLVPDCASSWLLPRLIGNARARELSLMGEKLSAEKALEWGLINRVFDDASLMEESGVIAKSLADGPFDALCSIRRLYWESAANDLEEQIALEDSFQAKCSSGPEFAEGVAAFQGKRKPDFRSLA